MARANPCATPRSISPAATCAAAARPPARPPARRTAQLRIARLGPAHSAKCSALHVAIYLARLGWMASLYPPFAQGRPAGVRRVVCCVMYVACCIGVQCTSLGPPFPAQVKARDDDLPLAQVAIAFEGLPWKHPDSFALMVMQSIVPSPSFPARHCALGRSFASPLPHRRVSPPVSECATRKTQLQKDKQQLPRRAAPRLSRRPTEAVACGS